MIDPKKDMQDKLAILSLYHNTNDFQVTMHLFFNGTKNAPNNVLLYIAPTNVCTVNIHGERNKRKKWVLGKALNSTLLKVIADVQVTRE